MAYTNVPRLTQVTRLIARRESDEVQNSNVQSVCETQLPKADTHTITIPSDSIGHIGVGHWSSLSECETNRFVNICSRMSSTA